MNGLYTLEARLKPGQWCWSRWPTDPLIDLEDDPNVNFIIYMHAITAIVTK